MAVGKAEIGAAAGPIDLIAIGTDFKVHRIQVKSGSAVGHADEMAHCDVLAIVGSSGVVYSGEIESDLRRFRCEAKNTQNNPGLRCRLPAVPGTRFCHKHKPRNQSETQPVMTEERFDDLTDTAGG